MSYNNKNHIRRREKAMQVTAEYYEPGRHDRCYKWVWRKVIRDQFHIEYRTYLQWIREEKARVPDAIQTNLFDDPAL